MVSIDNTMVSNHGPLRCLHSMFMAAFHLYLFCFSDGFFFHIYFILFQYINSFDTVLVQLESCSIFFFCRYSRFNSYVLPNTQTQMCKRNQSTLVNTFVQVCGSVLLNVVITINGTHKRNTKSEVISTSCVAALENRNVRKNYHRHQPLFCYKRLFRVHSFFSLALSNLIYVMRMMMNNDALSDK